MNPMTAHIIIIVKIISPNLKPKIKIAYHLKLSSSRRWMDVTLKVTESPQVSSKILPTGYSNPI